MPEIELHVTETAGIPRRRWPVRGGVPLARGILRAPRLVRLHDTAGRMLPLAVRVLARWPDSSVKWLLVETQVDVDAQERLALRLGWDSGASAPADAPADVPPADDSGPTPAARPSLSCRESEHSLDIYTGGLAVRVPRNGPLLLSSLSRHRHDYLSQSRGAAWTAVDDTGAACAPETEEALLVEQSALRLTVRIKGRLVRPGAHCPLTWQAWLTFYADQPWFVLRQWLSTHALGTVPLLRCGLTLHLPPPAADPSTSRRVLFGIQAETAAHGFAVSLDAPRPPDPGHAPRPAHEVRLSQTQPGRLVLHGGTADIQVPAMRAGGAFQGRGLGWVYAGDAESGLMLKLLDPHLHPAHHVSAAYGLLGLEIPCARTVSLPDLPQAAAEVRGPDTTTPGLPHTWSFACVVHAGTQTASAREVDARALMTQQRLELIAVARQFATSGAVGPLLPQDSDLVGLETRLASACRAPRRDSAEDPVHAWPASLLHQCMRTGSSTLLRQAGDLLTTLCAASAACFPAHPGAASEQQPHPDAPAEAAAFPGPETEFPEAADLVSALLDYHFLTGDPWSFAQAETCTQACRRAAPYAWRSASTATSSTAAGGTDRAAAVGVPLLAMGLFARATADRRFLRSMEPLVEQLARWQDDHGGWTEATGAFTRGAITHHQATILQGLRLYHEASGDERSRSMFLRGAHFLARNACTPYGMLIEMTGRGDAPPAPHASAALPSLGAAFTQAHDPALLKVVLRQSLWQLHQGPLPLAMLRHVCAVLPLLHRLDLLSSLRARDITASFDQLEENAEGESRGQSEVMADEPGG